MDKQNDKVVYKKAKAGKVKKMDFMFHEIDLKVDFVPPSLLQMNQEVAKNCSDELIDTLSSGLDEFGFMQPLIVNAERNVLVGTPRAVAAKKMNLYLVPILYSNSLTNEEKTAYVFSLGEYAKTLNMDKELFGVEVAELRNLGMVI